MPVRRHAAAAAVALAAASALWPPSAVLALPQNGAGSGPPKNIANPLQSRVTGGPLGVPTEHFYPSPWGTGLSSAANNDGWDEAYERAKEFVAGLTLTEKVNLTTGTGWGSDVCIGMTGGLPRLGVRGLCLQDGPVGVRYSM